MEVLLRRVEERGLATRPVSPRLSLTIVISSLVVLLISVSQLGQVVQEDYCQREIPRMVKEGSSIEADWSWSWPPGWRCRYEPPGGESVAIDPPDYWLSAGLLIIGMAGSIWGVRQLMSPRTRQTNDELLQV